MKTFEQGEIIRLIGKYLAKTADTDEIVAIEKWLITSNENNTYFLQLKNIWELSDKTIQLSDISTDKALKKVLDRIGKATASHSLWYYWKRIAAVLVITFLTAITIKFFLGLKTDYNREVVYNEVYATFGTRSALKLADGSLVWLNSGSSLKYPDKFIRSERQVILKGEAYFEVHSDKKHPFIVQTSVMTVKATGTKFSVSAFANDRNAEVTLLHGNVSVTSQTGAKKDEVISEMKPNQHLVLDTMSGKIELNNVDGYKYIAWKDGKLVFRNEPFNLVIKKISQLYKVDIELKGNELQDYRYRATFEDESLSEILKLLKLSSPIDYKEIKRQHLPDGSFSKRKVIIFKRHE
jgi:ferric-dicitrate binding protein FerR (iron transport regulator)